MSLLSWLGLAPAEGRPGDAEPIESLMRSLQPLEPGRARFLGLFAYLLARVANVDSQVSAAELARMERELVTWGQLPAGQAAVVARLAAEQNRLTGATVNFLAARELRDLASWDEKIAILQSLFAVSAADEVISGEEEEVIRSVSRELVLTNDEYLWVRSQYREKRAVMKMAHPSPP
jgi:uncharacterized tellurite resistance protein B-like protein